MVDFISMREWVSIDEAREYLSSKLNIPFSESALFDLVLAEQPKLRISIVLHESEFAEQIPDFIINKYQKIKEDGLGRFVELLADKGGTDDPHLCRWKDYLDSHANILTYELSPKTSNSDIDRIFPNEFITGLVSESGDIYNYPDQAREETDEWIDAKDQRRKSLNGVVDVCLFYGSYQELEAMKLKANGFNKEARLLPSPGLLVFDDVYGLCRLLTVHFQAQHKHSGEYLFGNEAENISFDDKDYEIEDYFDTCYEIKDLSAAQYCFRPKYLIDFVEKLKEEQASSNETRISNDPQKQQSFNEQSIALKLANKAFSRFWGNANPLEHDTHPKNRDISKWIQEESNHEISKTMADKITQVIRPEWAATGRKPQI